MANCLYIKGPTRLAVMTELPEGGFRYKLAEGEVAVVRPCSFGFPLQEEWTTSQLMTSEGYILVGNLIKQLTTKLGIKHCLKCRGRQYRYNRAGIEFQKKLLGK